MIRSKSILRVADNSGAKIVKCLRILKTTSASGKKKFAGVGDIILVSVRLASSITKIRKGNVFKAVVVRTVRKVNREAGILAFKDNAVVLLNKKMLPMGTRIFGPVPRELRHRNFQNIIALAVLMI